MKIEKCISPKFNFGNGGYFFTSWYDGNNKSFSSELEATTFTDTQDNGNYRFNPLYVKS